MPTCRQAGKIIKLLFPFQHNSPKYLCRFTACKGLTLAGILLENHSAETKLNRLKAGTNNPAAPKAPPL